MRQFFYKTAVLIGFLSLCLQGYGINRLVNTALDIDPANPIVGSLRWAIESAAAGDSVSFLDDGSFREILLSSALFVGVPITVIGPQSFALTIYLSGSNIPMIEIIGGVRNCRFENITFSGQGLGGFTGPEGLIIVRNDAELHLVNCQMEDYAILAPNSGAEIAGFLINYGTLRLDSCVVARNFPAGLGDYVIENHTDDTLEIYHTTFLLNQSVGAGTIRNRGWMDFQFNHFLFNGSPAGEILVDVGGSAHISSSVFEGNIEAGIVNRGSLQVDSSQFIQNFGSHGVAIENEDSTWIRHCYFADNSTTNEGGVLFQTAPFTYMTVEASTFHNNQASEGGALFAGHGEIFMTNSTFSRNVAHAKGGAIRKENARLVLEHNTFVENTANVEGGAIFSQALGLVLGFMELSNCLFLGNSSVYNPDIRSVPGGGAPMDVSRGYNIVQDTSNTGMLWEANDLLAIPDLESLVPLGELSDNGGPSPTFGLQKDSLGNNLALDAAGPSTIAVDQRGIPRKGRGDIGAFEYGEVEVVAPEAVICLADEFFELDSIVIEDPNGGAMLPGENLALILGLPPGLIFEAQTGAASASAGSGIIIRDLIVGANNLTLTYDRNFVTEGGAMHITGLRVKASGNTGNVHLTRIGGNAILVGNDLSDSLIHAEITVSGDVLQGDFQWKNVCEGQLTQFSDESLLNLGTAAYWRWEFGDPVSGLLNFSSDSMPVHDFTAAGTYQVQLIVGSNEFCLDTVEQTVNILDTLHIFADNPYDQTFEGEAAWVAGGTNSSWQWGEPNGTILVPPAEGKMVWATNLTGAYNNEENSWVNSPCFDLSDLDRPIWSMDIFSHTQEGFDGAVLQVSKDGGLSWGNVGEIRGGDSTGVNWYDEEAIIGNPGEQIETKVGWSSTTPYWRTARHQLDTIIDNSGGLLRFRVAFGSDGSQPTDVLEGFAFDNVFIGNRDRRILLEHFVNATISPNSPDTVQMIHDGSTGDAVTIQYHTDVPSDDPLFQQNWIDNSGRGLYYGISQNGLTIVDGNFYHGPPLELSAEDLVLRTLAKAQFDIRIDTSSAEVTLTPTEVWTGELLVHMAVVEDGVPHPGLSGKTINHVMRKMLPSAAGTYLAGPLVPGISTTISPVWASTDIPSPSIVGNPDSLRLIVWAQEPRTKEVLQVASSAIGPQMLSIREEMEEETRWPSSRVFPNPASSFLHVHWQDDPPEEGEWEFLDLRGKIVQNGPVPAGEQQFRLPLRALPAGMYLLQIHRPNHFPVQERIIVRN